MARPRTLPDSEVFAAILRILAAEGEKAVVFAAVARATGLAGASLVQRYGSAPAMLEAALAWGWDRLDAMTEEAAVQADGKGAQGYLKALGERLSAVPVLPLLTASQRSAALRERAGGWRARVEAVLAARMQDRDRAAILFAAWQGQVLWGGGGFRMKDAVKRLG